MNEIKIKNGQPTLQQHNVMWRFEFYCTWFHQIELLPRLTIIYSKETEGGKGIAFEFLWFGVFLRLGQNAA